MNMLHLRHAWCLFFKSLPATLILVGSGCGEPGSESVASTAEDSGSAPTMEGSADLPVWFKEDALGRGLRFQLEATLAETPRLPEIVPGGGAAFDFDDDGWMDVVLLQATGEGGSRLFRNLGEGRFEDVTNGSGLEGNGFGMGAATGDYDQDGDVDLFVSNFGPDQLFRNEGGGRFTDVTSVAGVGHSGFGASATFFDGDQDGDLDLFVTNYVDWSEPIELECRNRTGRLDYCPPVRYESPTSDVLHRNNGDGTFTDVSVESGIAGSHGTGLGVVARDFNGDGLPDVFVANDGMPDHLWMNRGSLRFEEQAMKLGCDRDLSGVAKAGMGVSSEDVDDDGDPDLIVCNLGGESDSFYLNDGSRFLDATNRAGLGSASRHFTRFGLGFIDFDNDGRLDLYAANGRVGASDDPDARDPYAEPDLLLRGDGDRFRVVAPAGGVASAPARTSRGAIFADFDNDGGQDVVVQDLGAPVRLLLNVVRDRGNWLTVDVRNRSGAPAIGAKVRFDLGDRTLTRWVHTDSSYLTAQDHRVHAGLGELRVIPEVEIVWRDGSVRRFQNIEAGRILKVLPEAD
ncbi:MAG: CRTAC1 family protein [Phycisphaerales bacterium]|nr:CRTAC1 family protein [Phycisphaerales bacterium]